MTMREMIVEFEFVRPHDPINDYAGGLTQGDIDELEEMLRDGT